MRQLTVLRSLHHAVSPQGYGADLGSGGFVGGGRKGSQGVEEGPRRRQFASLDAAPPFTPGERSPKHPRSSVREPHPPSRARAGIKEKKVITDAERPAPRRSDDGGGVARGPLVSRELAKRVSKSLVSTSRRHVASSLAPSDFPLSSQVGSQVTFPSAPN